MLFLIAGILILLILGGSYIIYRYAFYHVPGTEKDEIPLPPEQKKLMLQRTRELQETPCERVSISARDGVPLSARFYDAAGNAPVVIVCHGYMGSSDYSFACIFPWYREMGYRILLIDQRAHGQSGSRTITLGAKEKLDVVCWIRYIQKRFGADAAVSLWGVSMGGNAVLSASALCPELKNVVSDCAFTSSMAISRKIISEKCRPYTAFLLLLTRMGTRLWGGFSLKDGDALNAVGKSTVPTLFIHGEEDRFVPFYMGQELYDACAAPKYFLPVPDARHARSAAVHPELYEKELKDFLRKNS